VIYNLDTEEFHLYRLKEDPSEQYPVRLKPGHPDYKKALALSRLGESVDALGKSLPAESSGEKRELDPETLGRLKALGYME